MNCLNSLLLGCKAIAKAIIKATTEAKTKAGAGVRTHDIAEIEV